MPPASIAVTIRHNLEDLNLTIHMFNRNPLPRQAPIKQLLRRQQRTLFTPLERHFTVRMIRRHPLITTVRLDFHIRTHRRTRTLLVQSKIVNTPFGLLDRKNQERAQIDDQLRLYRMPLFLAGIVLPLFFFGRSIGLSVTSMAMVRGFCASAMSVFLPGKRKVPSRMRLFSTQTIDLWM